MADAGDIIAKIKVEYDPSGVKQAKEDLASLGEVGGASGEGVASISDALAGLDEQAGKTASSAKELTSSIGALEKPMMSGGSAVSDMNDALVEQQGIIDDTAKSLESIAEPMRSYTESLQGVTEAVSSGHLSENVSAFHDALENPYPFQMIQSYLSDTGQSWGDFTDSIGTDNTKMLHEMATTSDQTHAVMGGMSSDVQSMGKTFTESSASVGAFTEQFNAMGVAASDANKAVEETGGTIADAGKAVKSAGFGENISGFFGGIGEGASGVFGGVLGALNDIAMPLMAVQMIGMAVSAVGQSIYDAAAIAEGPAAHSFGTFTGAVDTLNKSAQSAWQTFSEGAGKGLVGTIDAINNVNASNKDPNAFWGALGESLGTITGGVLDIGALVGGTIIGGIAKTLTLDPGNTAGNDLVREGAYGLQNIWANLTGAPEPYQGPPVPGGMSGIDMGKIQQSLAQSAAAMQAQASDPTYLAAQAYLGSQQGKAQLAQAQYDTSHYTGVTGGPTDPMNAVVQYELNRMNGVGGLTNPDPNAAFFNSIATPGVGCFPAGTRVLMADGSERTIETLQVGERVLGHERASFIPTTVLALITPPPKKVYELTFDDGKTLTLTDSHPISTAEGWKSLHPRATKEENPDLAVSTLHIGDRVHTTGGMVTLTGILPREVVQIYNITVDEPHTFYANGVLVHNKVLGASASGSTQMDLGTQIMQSIGDISLPHMSMQGSNLVSSLASNFSAADLSHTFTATVNWIASGGLEHTFEGIANWIASGGLEHTFEGIANWIASGDLAHTFEGIVNWIASGGLEHTFEGVVNWLASGGLEHTFEGIVNWLASGGLEHTFEGIVSWIASGGLEHTFEGIVSWIGQNLEHTFTGVANWIGQNLSQTFTAVASWIPGFASGVQNFSGGLAVVGENGPELLQLPQGSSVYPMSDSSSGTAAAPPLLGNTGSGGAPQSFNISLHMDSQTLIAAMGIPLSQNVRLTSGMRSF